MHKYIKSFDEFIAEAKDDNEEEMTKAEKKAKKDKEDKTEKYKKWKELVNMTPSELSNFMKTEGGGEAGLTKKEASEQGIKSGKESAEWILKMKRNGSSLEDSMKNWGSAEWDWAGRQISFISRMKANKGALYDEDKKPTRKLLSLKIWGHNPEKK